MYRVSPATTPPTPHTIAAKVCQAFVQEVPLLEPEAALSTYQDVAHKDEGNNIRMKII